MRRPLKSAAVIAAAALGGLFVPYLAVAQVPEFGPDGPVFPGRPRIDPRIAEYQTITQGAKTYDGLFKLFQKDENVYAELTPQHLMGKQYLLPIAIAKGAGLSGMTANDDEQWVITFKRVGDKVHLIRRNVHHKARPGTPTAKAVEMAYTDSVLLALRIYGINQQTQGVLINLNDIFFGDIGELGIGRFDPSRSTWSKIKAFPRNVELEVQGTYAGGRADDSVIDARGKTVFVHYGIVELQDSGYQTRIADPRVGYFVTAQKDYTNGSKDTPFVRNINRWRLEPAEPITPGKLSVPKRSIKFYIEKTVPHEYRAAVQEGILEWNKAFEKIGFRNAIEAVQMRDDDEFDPEDMNYNTIRWVTNEQGYAIGPSRANPLTGEILDADILFDGDFIRFWKQERQLFRAEGKEFEPASPVQSLDQGWGLHAELLNGSGGGSWNDADKRLTAEERRLKLIRQGQCQCREHRRAELSLAALVMAEADEPKKADPKDPKKDDKKEPKKDDKKKEEKDALLEQYINQAIKDVIMHEVGHTLGLRHNFKASTFHPNDKLHDTKLTREQGLTASVMDYTPVNLAPKGVKQGDFFTTTLGPYDYWAIEYGYKPNATDEELKKIAAKGASTPGLDYGTDEDTMLTSDPHTNRFDLGADPMKYAQERMLATQDLFKTLPARVTEDGEGYQRTRVAFSRLLQQYGNSAYFVAKFVGGEYAHRDYKGDEKGRDPLVPVPAAKQREALKFLQDNVLSDKPYQFPPELLRKLAVDRWMHWGTNPDATDYPVYDRVLAIQKVALNQLFNAKVLQRVQATALKDDKEAKPLTLAEVFRAASDGVWTDLPKGDEKPASASSTIRRNLQREHLKKLSTLVLGERGGGSGALAMLLMMMDGGGGTVPADARSLARYHLKELAKRIDAALKKAPADADETTLAHLEECKERIAKVLTASMQSND